MRRVCGCCMVAWHAHRLMPTDRRRWARSHNHRTSRRSEQFSTVATPRAAPASLGRSGRLPRPPETGHWSSALVQTYNMHLPPSTRPQTTTRAKARAPTRNCAQTGPGGSRTRPLFDVRQYRIASNAHPLAFSRPARAKATRTQTSPRPPGTGRGLPRCADLASV